ncbi:tyrosine-type recombinase/integrase [Deinococcus wulumuqiensis]
MSLRTARAYREGIIRFLAHAQTRTVNLLRPGRDAGAVYVRSLETEGLKPASVRVHLAAARALFRALRWAGVTEADPFSDSKPAKDKVAPWDKRSPYSEDEVAALLAHAPLRDRVLILLCAHGGLRISEALALRWDEVEAGSLLVRAGKGGKSRRVTLSRTLATALADFRPGQSADLVVGGTQEAARKRLARIARLAGMESKGFHAFRHYAGTRIAGSLGLEDAARHLGHSSIETTRVYAKWADTALGNELRNW